MEKLYIVVQNYWEYNDQWYEPSGATTPLKAFRSYGKALEFRDERWLADVMGHDNLVWYSGGLDYLTSLDEDHLKTKVGELGFDPKKYKPSAESDYYYDVSDVDWTSLFQDMLRPFYEPEPGTPVPDYTVGTVQQLLDGYMTCKVVELDYQGKQA